MNNLATVEMISEDYEYLPTQIERGAVVVDVEGDVMLLGGDDMWYKMNRDGTFGGSAYDLDSITVHLVVDGNAYYPTPSLSTTIEVPDDWTWAKIRMSHYGIESTHIQQVRKSPDGDHIQRRGSTNSVPDRFDKNTRIVELLPDIKTEDN